MFYCLSYILLVVGVNVAFAHVPLITLPGGEQWPPVSLLVGVVFVMRDYAQRHVGHNVLWAMLAGCAISWFMASPGLALASAAAFAVGESVDWAVFTITKRPFSQRILWSSAVGTPLDSLVFLGLVNLLSPFAFISMTVSKMASSVLVYWLVRRRERSELASATI